MILLLLVLLLKLLLLLLLLLEIELLESGWNLVLLSRVKRHLSVLDARR